MTRSMIEKAQNCLMINGNGQGRKIIDLENLLHKHNTEMVLQLLNRMATEYEDRLKQLVITDKTSPEIDETIARMFRVHMAIKAIEHDYEEVIAA